MCWEIFIASCPPFLLMDSDAFSNSPGAALTDLASLDQAIHRVSVLQAEPSAPLACSFPVFPLTIKHCLLSIPFPGRALVILAIYRLISVLELQYWFLVLLYCFGFRGFPLPSISLSLPRSPSTAAARISSESRTEITVSSNGEIPKLMCLSKIPCR
ncbi:uncharacterized protein BO97DRAFT_180218 [Aspergillus homomorphus CBS 101889]|uniref:Uncharacterized protein n=1 Tax=Aspergillus homomorphus (strain CBS 101889) TaxID=1450537 RepID=A0A395I7F9_ASPHC|nr:hypothetical protein BO97DRAFT_180218 [Aspergillus homomorphus CBS 101889]RAL16061.1 hypothetical protein BO97DRAFT_180218 [Aspergillus homomorphus CBS 101889]